MDYSSTRNVDGLTYTLLRPMLDVWREEILRFLKDTRTEYLEDVSNQDPRWTRNRIRHALLPEMERVMDRSVRQVLWRTAEALREENAFLDAITEKFVTEKWLEVRELSFMQAAMQRRVVHRWLRLQRVPEISHAVVERVLGLVHSLRPAKVNLPGNRHARRRRGRIEVLQAVRLDSAD
jgi:tRNA(Ile)-lysidine synthase